MEGTTVPAVYVTETNSLSLLLYIRIAVPSALGLVLKPRHARLQTAIEVLQTADVKEVPRVRLVSTQEEVRDTVVPPSA